MAESILKRELAAILFADIVGYTSSMQENERVAMDMVDKYQAVLADASTSFDGKVVKNYGDGSLLLFPSSTNALNAAIKIQEACLGSLGIPLRIGIHVGEFVFKDGDIYGNGVNLASRIESMGVPGSVLFSDEVSKKVKNRPEYSMQSLGHFEFKNVSDPIEIFALTNEGMTIPAPSQMRGKGEKRQKAVSSWKIPAIILMLLIAAVAIWQGTKTESSSGQISLDDKEKNIAIAAFENQTMDPSLDAFGSMISDWATNGLKETGETNIINISNLPNTNVLSELEENADPDFVDKSGIELLLKGRYYLNEGKLMLIGDVVEISSGKTLHSFNVTDDKSSLTSILDKFTNEIQTFWSVKEQNRFLMDPPDYNAYKEWKKAQNLKLEDPAEALTFLTNAYRIDTNFLTPVFDSYAIARNTGNQDLATEIIELISGKTDNLSRYERLSFDYIKAVEAEDNILAAQLSEKRYQMDKTDFSSNQNAAGLYNSVNHPQKSLELLNSFDSRFLGDEERLLSWKETMTAFPNLMLGNNQQVDNIARNYKYPKISDALAVLHMTSLIRMDSLDILDEWYNYYRQQGLYNTSGEKTPENQILTLVCYELYCQDKSETLDRYLKIFSDWIYANPQNPDHNKDKGTIAFLEGHTEDAIKAWNDEELHLESYPGWMHLGLLLDQKSRLAYCHALLGNQQSAEAIIDQHLMNDQDVTKREKKGRQYFLARVLTGFGKNKEAISMLKNAVNNSFSFFQPGVFLSDPFLKPLHSDPDFREMLQPKG